MAVGDKILKNPKINQFTTTVVAPARGAINFQWGNAGGTTVTIESDLTSAASFDINPLSFNNINPTGGMITASDLAAIFQTFAYTLTAIRRANVRLFRTVPPTNNSWQTVAVNRMCALTSRHRLGLGTFNARVTAAPNPLTNLQPGNVASEASINALINRLASILSARRAEGAITINACHSSCHSACHSSRGRR